MPRLGDGRLSRLDVGEVAVAEGLFIEDGVADEVLSVFEDSPERLEELVATLKRLEAKGEASG